MVGLALTFIVALETSAKIGAELGFIVGADARLMAKTGNWQFSDGWFRSWSKNIICSRSGI